MNSLTEVTILEVKRLIIILKRVTVPSDINWPISFCIYRLYFNSFPLVKHTMCFCTFEREAGEGREMERNWMVSRCYVNLRPWNTQRERGRLDGQKMHAISHLGWFGLQYFNLWPYDAWCNLHPAGINHISAFEFWSLPDWQSVFNALLHYWAVNNWYSSSFCCPVLFFFLML